MLKINNSGSAFYFGLCSAVLVHSDASLWADVPTEVTKVPGIKRIHAFSLQLFTRTKVPVKDHSFQSCPTVCEFSLVQWSDAVNYSFNEMANALWNKKDICWNLDFLFCPNKCAKSQRHLCDNDIWWKDEANLLGDAGRHMCCRACRSTTQWFNCIRPTWCQGTLHFLHPVKQSHTFVCIMYI